MKRLLSLGFALLSCGAAFGGTNTFTGSGDWDTDGNWSLGRKPTAEDDVVIAKTVTASGANELVAGSLTINNGGKLTVGAAGMADIHPQVTVTGDFTMNGNAQFVIYAGATNEVYDLIRGGARVTVGGTTTLNDTASVQPWTHYTAADNFKADTALCTGAPVVFDFKAFVLGASAKFDATGKGFTRYAICPASCNITGLNAGQYWGGSHGGAGGKLNATDKPAPAYDQLLAPLLPGYAGGNSKVAGAGQGGGTIRILATTATVNGQLLALGKDCSWCGPGGGGSIWLTCDSLSVGSSAVFNVKGGDDGDRGYGKSHGTGAGGRISVCVGLTAEQIAALGTTGTADGIATNDLASVYPGQVNVIGGYKRLYGQNDFNKGGDGTAVYVVNATGKVGFSVENQDNFVASLTPALGVSAYAEGETVKASATSPAFEAGSTRVRRVCTGYEIRDDATGETLASGETTTVTDFKMPASPATLVWKWETVENKLVVSTIGGGSVDVTEEWKVSSEEFSTITATADDGYEFQYWAGDVDYADRFTNPLTLAADKPRTVKAFFGKTEGATYTMNKSNNNTVYNWHDAANWTPNGVPGSNDTAVIDYTGGAYRLMQVDDFAKVGALTVTGASAYLRVGCKATNTSKDIAAHTALADVGEVGLDVCGNLEILNGGWLAVGGNLAPHAVSVNVGGDLTVSGSSAKLGVSAAADDEEDGLLYDATSVVTVGGRLTVAESGVICPNANYKTGDSVEFVAGEIYVDETGAFNANALGYMSYTIHDEYVFPWPGGYDNHQNKYVGAAHAGKGGDNGGRTSTTYVGDIYGSKNTPVHPGSTGGNVDARGGGVIRLTADTVTVNGTLTACGHDSTGANGSGSGGSVWVVARRAFASGEQTMISVRGGKTTGSNRGTGGGGRIAVCVGLTDEQLAAVRDSDDVEGVKFSALSEIVPCTTEGGDIGGYDACQGQPGTAVHMLNTLGAAPLNILGVPENIGIVEPVYGMTTVDANTEIPISAPAAAFVIGTDEGSRRLCGGYSFTNNTDGIIKSSTSLTDTLVMPGEESWLVWNWPALEHRLTLAAREGGHLVTNEIGVADSEWQPDGSTVRVTAVADEGFVFLGWLGKFDGIAHDGTTIELPMTKARAVTACFASTTPTAKSWTGGAGSWMEAEKWSPAGVPGPSDTVSIAGGPVTVDCGFPVKVRSLTVAAWRTLTVTDPNNDPSSVIGFEVEGDFTSGGFVTVGTLGQKCTSRVKVGGDLTLTEGVNFYLTVYAGTRDNPESPEMYRLGGGQITVGGTLTVASNLKPICDSKSGAPVVISAQRVVVPQGGVVNATAAGYHYTLVDGAYIGYKPGSPSDADLKTGNYEGGSYGGLGAPNNGWGNKLTTSTYGLDYAPFMPGSEGGNYAAKQLSSGGAVRIDCKWAEIYGSVLANALDASYGGGASGGAIWLTCRKIKTAETTVFSAHGGVPCPATPTRSGGGGGGRICITRRATPEQIEAMYAGEPLPPSMIKTDLTVDAPIAGTFNVNGGSREGYPAADGQPGTAVLVEVGSGLMIMVR